MARKRPYHPVHHQEDEYANLAFHPYNVMLVFIMISISMLFLALSSAYIYNRVQADLSPVRIPNIFLFNTVLLLASSVAMIQAKKHYTNDYSKYYKLSLYTCIGLSFVFLILQGFGWYQLFEYNKLVDTGNSSSYLYLLSGLHFIHIIAGLPFLILFSLQANKQLDDGVASLVYFSDPEQKLRLRLISMYWHLLDGLWLFLMLFFLLHYYL